jgi:hypothetical protein
MQVGRVERFEIGGLQFESLPIIIKAPVMAGGPTAETEAFSPLALGLSMRIDYRRGVLMLGRTLPDTDYDIRLPLRMQHLALVRAKVNGSREASFVLDTGGDVTTLSRRLAGELDVDPELRRVPVRVWGTSGWDRSAFLLPYVHIELAPGTGIANRSLAVLDLGPVSALLGVDLGGIIGHEFLSEYQVSIDLERHEVGLTRR